MSKIADEEVIRNPNPARATIISPMVAAISAYGSAFLRPAKIQAMDAGATALRNCSRRVAPMSSRAAIQSPSTACAPANVLKNSSRNETSATSAIFGSMPRPNHMIRSGASATTGTLLSATMNGRSSEAGRGERPSQIPSTIPAGTPIARPIAISASVTAICQARPSRAHSTSWVATKLGWLVQVTSTSRPNSSQAASKPTNTPARATATLAVGDTRRRSGARLQDSGGRGLGFAVVHHVLEARRERLGIAEVHPAHGGLDLIAPDDRRACRTLAIFLEHGVERVGRHIPDLRPQHAQGFLRVFGGELDPFGEGAQRRGHHRRSLLQRGAARTPYRIGHADEFRYGFGEGVDGDHAGAARLPKPVNRRPQHQPLGHPPFHRRQHRGLVAQPPQLERLGGGKATGEQQPADLHVGRAARRRDPERETSK